MHSRRFLADLLALLGVLVLLLSGFMPAGAAPAAALAAATAPEPQPAPEPAGWLNSSGEPAPVAETVSWTGAAGDGLWSNPANWSPARVPRPTDVAHFSGNVSSAHLDQATILGGLALEADFTGILDLDAPLQLLGDLHMAGGAIRAGSAPVEIQGAVQVRGGLLTTPAGAVMAVRSLHIEQPGIVRLGQEGKLELSGEGEPLTGNGVLDTTTNRPNSVEYTGRSTTDLMSAGPAAGLRAAVPEGLRRAATLELPTPVNGLRCAVIDQAAGFAYFGADTVPGVIVKVRLSDFTRVGTLILYGGEDYLRSAVIDLDTGFAYFGTDTEPAIVVKVDLATFTRAGALTLDIWHGVRSSVIDPTGGYAYFGTSGSPGRVAKIRLSDFTQVSTLIMNSGEDTLSSAVIDPAAGYAYFGTRTFPGTIVKVRLSDFTRVDALPLSGGEDNPCSAVIDPAAGYAYLGTGTAPGRVVRVRLSDFTRDGTLIMNNGEDYFCSAQVDLTGGYAYFGTITSPGIIVKVDLATFARVSSLTLAPGEDSLVARAIDPEAGFAYWGTLTMPGQIVKVDLATFTRVGAIVLEGGEGIPESSVIDGAAGYAYLGTSSSPGRVVKIRLSSFTSVGVLTLATGENLLTSAVIDPAAGFAYWGTQLFPCYVVKVNLANFTRVGAVAMNANEQYLHSAMIDPSAGYAYFIAATSPSQIVRIRLSDFTRTGALALGSDESPAVSAAIDPATHLAYLGTSTTPGRVVKIDLTTFTRVSSIILNTGENSLDAALIDPAAGYAYFGTYTSPGRVVRVNLATFSRVGAISLNTGENYLIAAAIHPDSGYAYFGTWTNPGRIIQVDLASFTRADALGLEMGEQSLRTAVIEPDGEYVYFAATTMPARIIKVDTGLSNPAIRQAVTPPALRPGESITFTLAFSNTGSALATNVWITDVLPLEITAVQVISSGVAITEVAGSRYSWRVQDLPGDIAGTITITGVLTGCLPTGYTLTNTATIDAARDALEDDSQSTTVVTVLNRGAPRADADAYTGTQDLPLVVPTPGVLANDIDDNCDPLAAALDVPPSNGTLALAADGSFTYTPTLGWVGNDSFAYIVSDGQFTAGAVVSLTIVSLNDAPMAVDDAYTTTQDTWLVVPAPGVLGNDEDSNPLMALLLAPPQSGALALALDGSFIYTPTLGWSGVDSFRYAASDGDLTGTAQVIITVTASNRAPLAADDAYTVTTNTPLVVPAPGVLGNDVDPEGSPLLAVLVDPPARGILGLNQDGSLVYMPAPDFTGPITFTYAASDGQLTATAVVLLDVRSANHAPVAVGDAYSTTVDAVLMVPAPGVLGNDYDNDGNPLTAVLDSLPATGTLAMNDDGSFIYLPAAGWSGTITFTYHADDGLLSSPVAMVTIEVLTTCQAITRVTMVWTPALPIVGQVVDLTGQAEGSQPITWSWTFDDGTVASGQQVTHTFGLAGTHLVTLTVANGCSGPLAIARQLTVTETPGLEWKAYLPLILK